jgi:hypothetical protein
LANSVSGLFPLIKPLPGVVGNLFPVIQPSPSPAGAPPAGRSTGRRTHGRPAAASQMPVNTTADDSMQSSPPFGGGQVAALIFLALAIFTVAAARFRARPPSPAPATGGPPGRLVPSAYEFPVAHAPARPAAASQMPASTTADESPPASTADNGPPASTAADESPPATTADNGPPASTAADESRPAATSADAGQPASFPVGRAGIVVLTFLAAALAAGIVRLRVRRRG